MTRSSPIPRDLARRVAALEERVTRLEARRPPPGDGRTTRLGAGPTRSTTRAAPCEGCGLPLRRREGRCAHCGRPLDL